MVRCGERGRKKNVGDWNRLGERMEVGGFLSLRREDECESKVPPAGAFRQPDIRPGRRVRNRRLSSKPGRTEFTQPDLKRRRMTSVNSPSCSPQRMIPTYSGLPSTRGGR